MCLGHPDLYELFLGKPYVSSLKGDMHHALQQTLVCTTAVLAEIKSLHNIIVL